MNHFLTHFLVAMFLASCAAKQLERCPPGTPGILVPATVKCTHKNGTIILPAGEYAPEAQAPEGIYYVAPEPVTTNGVLRKGKERGGLFIAHEGWQWLWTGHPAWEVDQSATTFTGKRGIIMPTHYKFEPFITFQKTTR
jgi:hypothetical protein